MKNIAIITVFSILLLSCNKETRQKQSAITKAVENNLPDIDSKVIVEESTAEEFEQGLPNLLVGVFSGEYPKHDTLPKPPVVINTQNQNLIFKDINPISKKNITMKM
jgi:hypothetical protein